MINANGNQQTHASGNQVPNASGNQQTNPVGADRRGYYTHVPRFQTAPIPGTVPRQINSMAQTPINTQLLINNSRAVLRATHAETASQASASGAPAYVADKDIDW